MEINIKKTECLFGPVKNLSIAQVPEDILVHGEALVQTKSFVYLGSNITDNARLDSELILRMGKASAAYGKLQERLCKVYKAIVLSTLLYGAETWTVYRTQVKKLNAAPKGNNENIMEG